MSAFADPCTARWVQAQVEEVLARHDPVEIQEWMPLILLLMARDFGYKHLDEGTRAALNEALVRIGATGRESNDEMHALVLEYIRSLALESTLIAELSEVLATHDRARADRVRRAERVLGRRPARLSVHQYGTERPKDTETGAMLARRSLGQVRP